MDKMFWAQCTKVTECGIDEAVDMCRMREAEDKHKVDKKDCCGLNETDG